MTTTTATVNLTTAPLPHVARTVIARPFTDVEARLGHAVAGALDLAASLRREAAWGEDQQLEDLATRLEAALDLGRDPNGADL
jgi:hypothetical protein